MWPALQNGDLVFTTPLSADSRPQVGDLILREIDGDLILHRLLEKDLTKGDRFLVADPAGIDKAFLVRRIVPRRFANKRGRLFSVDDRKRSLRRMGTRQARLSLFQLQTKSYLLKRLATVALISNGWLIRATYYLSLERSLDVVP